MVCRCRGRRWKHRQGIGAVRPNSCLPPELNEPAIACLESKCSIKVLFNRHPEAISLRDVDYIYTACCFSTTSFKPCRIGPQLFSAILSASSWLGLLDCVSARLVWPCSSE